VESTDQQLTRPEEEPEDGKKKKKREEMAEHMVTFFYTLKGLQVARKCIFQIGIEDSIITMCKKLENKLYRLRAKEKKNQHLLTG
jgi:hypothetical protein